jgi:hypothetical protein
MKLIATKAAANAKFDRLRFERSDGSHSEIEMPRQGILPHDLIHFVVEQGLGMRQGFLSLVANGAAASFAMEVLHGPEAKERQRQAVQAEALVEALQTQLWSGTFDAALFHYGLQTACVSRSIDVLVDVSDAAALALFDEALRLNEVWRAVAPFETLTLDFAPSPSAS